MKSGETLWTKEWKEIIHLGILVLPIFAKRLMVLSKKFILRYVEIFMHHIIKKLKSKIVITQIIQEEKSMLG